MLVVVWSMLATGCGGEPFVPTSEPAPVVGTDGPIEDPEVDPDPTDTGATAPTDPVTELPSAYTWVPEADDDVPLDLLTVAHKLEEVVAGVRDLNSTPIFDAFDASMTLAQGSCPGGTSSRTERSWRTWCTTAAGTVFDGYMNHDLYDASSYYQGESLSGVGTVTTSAGVSFLVGGGAYDWRNDGSRYGLPYTTWVSMIQGVYAYDGPAGAGTWIASGITPNVTLSFGEIAQTGARWGTIEGVQSLEDPDFVAVSFGELQVWNEAWGAECWQEPAGVLALRGTDGNWYELHFDGGMEGTEPDACDGCGEVYWRGQDLGQLCLDTSTWLEWTGSPW